MQAFVAQECEKLQLEMDEGDFLGKSPALTDPEGRRSDIYTEVLRRLSQSCPQWRTPLSGYSSSYADYAAGLHREAPVSMEATSIETHCQLLTEPRLASAVSTFRQQASESQGVTQANEAEAEHALGHKKALRVHQISKDEAVKRMHYEYDLINREQHVRFGNCQILTLGIKATKQQVLQMHNDCADLSKQCERQTQHLATWTDQALHDEMTAQKEEQIACKDNEIAELEKELKMLEWHEKYTRGQSIILRAAAILEKTHGGFELLRVAVEGLRMHALVGKRAKALRELFDKKLRDMAHINLVQWADNRYEAINSYG